MRADRRMLVDSHVNLHAEAFAEDRDAVVARARAAGIVRMIAVCARLSEMEEVVAAAAPYEDVFPTLGAHPHHAKDRPGVAADEIVALARDAGAVAIGETGLDFHYDHSPHPVQKEAFRKQIAIAKELQKPLVVHTRSAPQETLQILREEQAQDVGGIIHCFSEDAPFAAAALDLGFVSSFSGIVTFKKAVAVHEAALKQPADALLVETDAPYLAPMPKRGKRNEPAYVAYTAARIAELRGEDPEALAHTTYQNALRIFGIEE